LKRALTILIVAIALGLSGCAGTYTNQNGPRGPESVEYGTDWPWPLSKGGPCGPKSGGR
jgi:uncharacterized protein YceK